MQSIDTIAEVINKKASVVTTVPSNPDEGTLILFLGADPNFVTGGLYQYSSSTWVQLFAVTKGTVGLGNVDNTADANKHVASADAATTATNADITKTADTTNGDQLQIGTGAAINVTNAYHAATADVAATTGTAAHATSADSAAHATSADSAAHATSADSAAHATSADSAAHATSADSATHATSADNADTLDGVDKLCFMHERTGNDGTTAQFQAEIVNNGLAGPCCGSYQIADGPAGKDWYNYMYIPHRTGVGSDSHRYGTLIVVPMTYNSNRMFIKHQVKGTWYDWEEIRAGVAATADKIRTSTPSNLENGDIWIG